MTPIHAIQSNSEYKSCFITCDLSCEQYTEIEFNDCIFKDCDLTETKLRETSFERCRFENCNLNMTQLSSTKLLDVMFNKCKIYAVDWGLLKKTFGISVEVYSSDLSYSLFSGASFTESKFERCKFHEADFTDSEFPKCSFERSDFLRATFNRTDLRGANFTDAVNYIIDARYNKLKKARFTMPEAENLLLPFEVIIE